MDSRSQRLLELDKILLMLAKKCATPMAAALAQSLTPAHRREDVLDRQQQTGEAVKLLTQGEPPPLSGLTDTSPDADRAAKGGVLDAGQLYKIAVFVQVSTALKKYLLNHTEPESWFNLAAHGLADLPQLAKDLTRSVDRDGNVLDTASPQLRSLRRSLDTARARLRERLEGLVKSPTIQKYLQEPLVTQRGGRYCLPVKSECRAQVPGVVHDQSASGATLFVEPMAVVEASNDISVLERKEQAEVYRILKELSARVGDCRDQLVAAVLAAAEIDLALAKGRLALTMAATAPTISSRNHLNIISGRHPLLPADEVVPVSVSLGKEYSVLVITGPNTGGKTVTLKTIGLFCLMAQCGLWLPAGEGSEVPVYNSIFADIGDEQSIEQSLSTFSSHMTNIVSILERVCDRSLVLLDELGAGTDPAEGAALATALLEKFKQLGAAVVATTHYSELKAYAWTEPGVQNASVEFDIETLRPTYRLLIGTPGKSNAFEIAQRLGLAQEVVARARTLLDSDDRRTEDMLAALEEQRKQAEANLAWAARTRREAEELKEIYQQRLAKLAGEKNRLLEQAREKANEVLNQARRQAEEMLEQLRRAQASANVDDLARQTREKLKPVAAARPPKQEAGPAPAPDELRSGQQVQVLSLGKVGTILSLTADEVVVQVGIMKVSVKHADLRLVAEQVERKERGRTIARSPDISPEIDLRGKLVDDACLEVDKFLDSALLAGLEQVHLIHGKGTGALGRGLHQYLKTHHAVSSFRYGNAGEGGSGVTVVKLKK